MGVYQTRSKLTKSVWPAFKLLPNPLLTIFLTICLYFLCLEGKRLQGESSSKSKLEMGLLACASPQKVARQLSFCEEPESNCRRTSPYVSQQLMILNELEFRKLFLVLSYIGWLVLYYPYSNNFLKLYVTWISAVGSNKLEDVISPQIADDIVRKKNLSMTDFESEIWNAFGKACYAVSDRSKVHHLPSKAMLFLITQA